MLRTAAARAQPVREQKEESKAYTASNSTKTANPWRLDYKCHKLLSIKSNFSMAERDSKETLISINECLR